MLERLYEAAVVVVDRAGRLICGRTGIVALVALAVLLVVLSVLDALR